MAPAEFSDLDRALADLVRLRRCTSPVYLDVCGARATQNIIAQGLRAPQAAFLHVTTAGKGGPGGNGKA